MPLVEQELQNLPEHLSSSPSFSRVQYTQSLVSCGVFYRPFVCPFCLGLCIVCISLIYDFWLPLWYLQTFLVTRSLVLYVCFVDRCLSFCTFSFGLCIVCIFFIYGFWLPLWYLRFTASDYPFGFFYLRLLITPLVS